MYSELACMPRTAAAYIAGIHIGVGFCVARSDYIGQCEGLRVSGRATGTDSRAFSVCSNSLFFKPHRLREPVGKKTEKAMKTIIAISGQGNIGKSHAIIEIARRFPMEEKLYFNCYTKEPVAAPDEGLVLCCGKYSTGDAVKTIGFSSEGDTQEPVNNALDVFLENNETEPDVLVMACRSKGDSVFAIRKFATEHGYNVIWTSNYCGRTYGSNGFEGEACAQFPNGTDLNGIFAENIVSLINKLLS